MTALAIPGVLRQGISLRLPTIFEPLRRAHTESAAFAYLDADGRLLGMRHLHSALADVLAIPVRRIAMDALAFDAAGVLMAHNHPSGDHQPSAQDRSLTARIARTLDAIEVRLVDHWVLAQRGETSFRALGLL